MIPRVRWVREIAPSLLAPFLAVGGILVLASTAGCDTTESETGPVTFLGADEGSPIAAVDARPGSTVVFGEAAVRNDGTTAAVLEAGSLVGNVPAAAARLLEVRVKDITASDDMVGGATWPYQDYRRRSGPLEGYRLPPGAEVELLFIVRVVEAGEWYWPTTKLQYTVDGHEHEASTALGFEICPAHAVHCSIPPE